MPVCSGGRSTRNGGVKGYTGGLAELSHPMLQRCGRSSGDGKEKVNTSSHHAASAQLNFFSHSISAPVSFCTMVNMLSFIFST
jgi:hypothetical protein